MFPAFSCKTKASRVAYVILILVISNIYSLSVSRVLKAESKDAAKVMRRFG